MEVATDFKKSRETYLTSIRFSQIPAPENKPNFRSSDNLCILSQTLEFKDSFKQF